MPLPCLNSFTSPFVTDIALSIAVGGKKSVFNCGRGRDNGVAAAVRNVALLSRFASCVCFRNTLAQHINLR